MSKDILDFIGEYVPAVPDQGAQVSELCRGLTARQNSRNPFVVITLRYEADPEKDPETPEGKEWWLRTTHDMGCYRMCRVCDKAWGIRDEECPDCLNDTELVLSNKWKREYEIDYQAQSGSYVFDAFSRGRNVCKPFRIPATWRRYRVIDHGFRNPTACLWIAVDEDKNAWCYAEHYESGESVDHHAMQIHRTSALVDHHALGMNLSDIRAMDLKGWEPTKEFMRKCAKLYRTIGDPSMGNRTSKEVKTIKTRYAESGVFIGDANRTSAGFETVNTMFSANMLTIFDTCPNTIREVEHLVWAEHNDPARNKKEKPVDRDDHTPDCLKYFANEFAPATAAIQAREIGQNPLEAKGAEDRARFKEGLAHRPKGKGKQDNILDF